MKNEKKQHNTTHVEHNVSGHYTFKVKEIFIRQLFMNHEIVKQFLYEVQNSV